jgi:hypothetical protein
LPFTSCKGYAESYVINAVRVAKLASPTNIIFTHPHPHSVAEQFK